MPTVISIFQLLEMPTTKQKDENNKYINDAVQQSQLLSHKHPVTYENSTCV